LIVTSRFDAARREKSVFGRERLSDRAPHGSSVTTRPEMNQAGRCRD
jgi:hypothetical protein